LQAKSEPPGDLTAEGVIESTFTMEGRGFVLVLEREFRETVYANGIVESDQGSAAYGHVEFALHRGDDGVWEQVAVIVDCSARGLFAAGERVRFFRQIEDAAAGQKPSPKGRG
jgi:hypothetical protein